MAILRCQIRIYLEMTQGQVNLGEGRGWGGVGHYWGQ